MAHRWSALLFATIAALSAPRAARAQETLASGLVATPAAEYGQYEAWSPPELPEGALLAPGGGAGSGEGLVGAGIDLRPFLPPPRQQGAQNSCAAWAAAYGLQTYFEATRRGRPPTDTGTQFSPAYLYNQVNGGKDAGSNYPTVLATLQALGGVTLDEMPYSDRDHERQPSREQLASGRDARILSFARLQTREDVRDTLRFRLPVLIGVEVSERFLFGSAGWEVWHKADWEAGVRDRKPDLPHRLHALLVVGFDDGRQAFLVLNSWGPEWGRGGFAWLHYDAFDRIAPAEDAFAREAWVAFPRHGMSPQAEQALGGTSGPFQAGLFVDATHGRTKRGARGTWSWQVTLLDETHSLGDVASVEWTWQQGLFQRKQLAESASDGFGVSGTFGGDGYLVVSGDVRFRDGTRGRVTRDFLFVDPVRPLAIDVRDRYWGREDDGHGGTQPTWLHEVTIGGSDEDYDRIRRVVWQLDESFGGAERVDDDPADGFWLDLRGDARPSVLGAVVELADGTSRRVRTTLVPFSEVVDEPRIDATWGSRRDEHGELRHFVALGLRGPWRDLRAVRSVTYHVPGPYAAGPLTVESREGDGGFLVDTPPRTEAPAAFDVRAELRLRDGGTRTVHGRFEPPR